MKYEGNHTSPLLPLTGTIACFGEGGGVFALTKLLKGFLGDTGDLIEFESPEGFLTLMKALNGLPHF